MSTTYRCHCKKGDLMEVETVGSFFHFRTISEVGTDVVLTTSEVCRLIGDLRKALGAVDLRDQLEADADEEAEASRMAADVLDPVAGPEPALASPTPKVPSFVNLSPQAQTIYKHIQRAGSISALDAMNVHGVTSATLSRRICDIEQEGFKVKRERRTHPITGKQYTRYSLKD